MEKTNFLQHYESLMNTYNNTDDIVCIFRNQIRTLIHERSQNGKYKYQIYLSINPTLIASPLLETLHPTSKDMTRFRLGSHYLPIETGRWCGTDRQQRKCNTCHVMGDEHHAIYTCSQVV